MITYLKYHIIHLKAAWGQAEHNGLDTATK